MTQMQGHTQAYGMLGQARVKSNANTRKQIQQGRGKNTKSGEVGGGLRSRIHESGFHPNLAQFLCL